MHTRYIQVANTFGPSSETSIDTWKTLKKNFPPLASRRMTQLALMIGECLKDQEIQCSDSVLYVTTFSETLCLEKFLDSFPNPSPLMFQNSIHPSGMEQVLIAKKQSAEEFLAFGGNKNAMHSALVAAFTSENPTQWLIGAEEKGTWLTEKECASDQDFALALKLTDNPAAALAKLSWQPLTSETVDNPTVLTTFGLLELIQQKHSGRFVTDSMGVLTIDWLS